MNAPLLKWQMPTSICKWPPKNMLILKCIFKDVTKWKCGWQEEYRRGSRRTMEIHELDLVECINMLREDPLNNVTDNQSVQFLKSQPVASLEASTIAPPKLDPGGLCHPGLLTFKTLASNNKVSTWHRKFYLAYKINQRQVYSWSGIHTCLKIFVKSESFPLPAYSRAQFTCVSNASSWNGPYLFFVCTGKFKLTFLVFFDWYMQY